MSEPGPTPAPPEDTIHLEATLPPAESVFLTALLDGYEGLCLHSSREATPERMSLEVPQGQMELLQQVLGSLELVEGRIELRPREAGATSPEAPAP